MFCKSLIKKFLEKLQLLIFCSTICIFLCFRLSSFLSTSSRGQSLKKLLVLLFGWRQIYPNNPPVCGCLECKSVKEHNAALVPVWTLGHHKHIIREDISTLLRNFKQWEALNAPQTVPQCRQTYHIRGYHLSCILKTSPWRCVKALRGNPCNCQLYLESSSFYQFI